MGLLSKDSKKVSAGSSRRSWWKFPVAWMKKMILLSMLIMFFSIYNRAFVPSSAPQTDYLNQAFVGNMGWFNALKLTAWQGLEFGTRNVITFIENMITYFGNAQPVEAIFLAFFPLALVYTIWLIPVTMVFDIWDQRKMQETSYLLQMFVALVVVGMASAMVNGVYVFNDFRENQQCDELTTFVEENQTYLTCEVGNANHTVSPQMYVDYNVTSDVWVRNMTYDARSESPEVIQ